MGMEKYVLIPICGLFLLGPLLAVSLLAISSFFLTISS